MADPDLTTSGTKVETTPEDRELRGPGLSSWVALLTALSIVGYAYWQIAAYAVVRQLAETYSGQAIVAVAKIVPNTAEALLAVMGLTVAIGAMLIGIRSVRSATRTCYVLAIIALISVVLFPVVGGYDFWTRMLSLVVGVVMGTVVALLSGFDISVETAPTVVQKEERHLFLTGWLFCLCFAIGGQVTVALSSLRFGESRALVSVPELGEVAIVRSDAAGHLALDDHSHLMWLSRSKVPEIRGVHSPLTPTSPP